MKHRLISIALVLGMPLYALAQNEAAEAPEEIIVVGQRAMMELRLEMWNLEKAAYEVFNAFNDEKRFDISCSAHAISGTRLKRQLCQPEFEIQAMAREGRASLDSFRAFLAPIYANSKPGSSDGGAPVIDSPVREGPPAAMAIASQQEAYRAKMKEVAAEHPEFLEALIDYSEARARYEAATSTGDSAD